MPLVFKNQVGEETFLALWKMDEDTGSLEDLLIPDENEAGFLKNILLEKRKKEWLAVRILIRLIAGSKHMVDYYENGQPYLPGTDYKISISHSKDIAGIILSKKFQPGLDIELISSRVEKIRLKFLSKPELKNIREGENFYKHMLAHWCAKETLVKICGDRTIDFIRYLKIFPFEYTGEGTFTGIIEKKTGREQHQLNYFEMHGNLVVWSI